MERARRFEVDGATLVGWEVGAGRPVVLLHAGGERSGVWRPVVAELRRQRDVRCLAVDQRGHGGSGGRADRLRQVGDDAATVLRSVGRPCLVVGASLGGLAAIDALRHPDIGALVAGLVLVDVVPDPDPVGVRAFLGSIGMLERRRPLVEDILGSAEHLRQCLADAAPPTTLVRATNPSSSALGDDDVARLRDLVPELVVAPVAAGHLVARDAPVALARILTDAVDRAWSA